MAADSTERPAVTEARLGRDLADLGIGPGMLLTVHSSLSSLGWVAGGAPAVVRALLTTLGDDGTLAVPAATPQCAEPCGNPQLFDRATTPTSLGAIPETVRTWDGTLRSDHPLESVCALGPLAAEIVADHPLDFSEGPGTPFGRLHDLGSHVLLLGVGFNRCTALHLAETMAKNRRTTTIRLPRPKDGGGLTSVEVTNVADDNDTHFPVIGAGYLAAGRTLQGPVGEAMALLFSMRDLVRFAVPYFERIL
jgi:aminoglycoside 3-N-acetyltransferase